MIFKLTINDHQNTPIHYWKDHSVLTSLKEISFEPGVNILCGKNKSGKSSILRLLAHFFYAYESGKTYLCPTGHRAMHPYVYVGGKDGSRNTVIKSATIDHDEQGVGYANFGPAEYYKKAPIFDEFFAKFPPRTAIPIARDNFITSADITIAEEFFKSSRTIGAPTLLLDTPDGGLDLLGQFALWDKLSQVKPDDYQLIIATNSPFALGIPGFNYIELTPGFYSTAKGAVSSWAEALKDSKYSMDEYRSGKAEANER